MTDEKEIARSPHYGKLDLDVYSVTDVQERLGLRRQTIQKAIRAGELRSTDFGGSRGYLILKDDLVSWIRTRPARKRGGPWSKKDD